MRSPHASQPLRSLRAAAAFALAFTSPSAALADPLGAARDALSLWEWFAVPLLLLVGVVSGRTLGWGTRRALGRLTRRTSAAWDDLLLERLGGPLAALWSAAVIRLLVPSLHLAEAVAGSLARALWIALFLIVFWALFRAVGVAVEAASTSAWAHQRPAARALLPLAGRVASVALVIAAAIAVLSELGYNVASLVAGLGVGGLAVALAAQKTLEHVFGAFSIGLDQPFREGDFVRVDGEVGTVEAIGLRSTRIRTLDRTLISIPNGKLADMRLESFTARDRMRLACTVGVVYGTTADQMRAVLVGLERVLREHPKIWPDAVVVRFKELGASSLDIEVMAWFETPDWSEFQLIRQEVLLRFLEIVEQAGTSFAFPTQTVHLIGEARAATPALQA